MTAKPNFRTDPEFTVFALLAAWKLCPCHLHLHHNLHQVNNYTWFYIHQLCTLLPSSNEQLTDSCRSFYGKSAFYVLSPPLISTTNYFQDYSIRIKVEHFHLFAALKDIVGSATPSSPGCRAGGGSWSTSCPSWSSGHQDSSPVTHPYICK